MTKSPLDLVLHLIVVGCSVWTITENRKFKTTTIPAFLDAKLKFPPKCIIEIVRWEIIAEDLPVALTIVHSYFGVVITGLHFEIHSVLPFLTSLKS